MVKSSDGKSTSSNNPTVQTQQTFRTISQPQMRMIAMPAGSVQTAGTAQIIQTHIMSQTMLKQVETTTRTQITALPSRTMPQGASITVSRAPTPNFLTRGPSVATANLRGTINAPIRTPTPPAIVTNVPFVRGGLSSKTPSSGGTTVISPGSAQTWISGGNVQVQVPTQIIRAANISAQSPRGQSRIIAQATTNTVNSTNASISSNSLNQGGANQNPQQTFVATLATVLPSRQPAAALVYSSVSNPQQYSGTGPRLTVATSLGGQKQVRPIQLGNARLPTSGMGIRVSTTNISIRAPNVPVLAPTSVLTSIPSTIQGRNISTTTTTNNLTTSIPAARIIQVQQQPSGTQVINTGRIAGNLMTLHPVIMNTNASNNRIPTTIATKVQPSLTITHVKSALGQSSNLSSGNMISSTISGIPQSGTITITQAQTNQQQMSLATASSVSGQQNSVHPHIQQQSQHITQLVSMNQQGIVNQGHQLVVTQQQILGGTQGQSIATMVPVAINTRSTNVLTGTITSIPSVSTTLSSNRSTIVPVSSGTTILPIAKVLPQQQHITASGEMQHVNTSIAGNSISSANIINPGNQVLIHARSPNNSIAGGICGSNSVSTITNVISNSGSFLPTSGTFYYEHTTNSNSGNPILTLTTSSTPGVNSGNMPTNIVTSYAPSGGSFAVVPTNNRGLNQNYGIVPTSNQVHSGAQIQAIPVRFNPQLIVDGSQSHNTSGSHQIIMSQSSGVGPQNNTIQQQPTQMLIPVPTKMTSSPRPSILKKRENEGILTTHMNLKAIKNLGPSLVSVSAAAAAASCAVTSNVSAMEIDKARDRNPSPISRPGSSDGSTTVSATSSPGIDQQEHEELASMSGMQMRIPNEMQFKPVEIYQQTQSMQQTNVVPSNLANSGQSGIGLHHMQHQVSTGSSSNDNDMTPRKKPRKQQLGGENNMEPHLQYVNEDAVYSTDHNVIKSMISNGTNLNMNMSNNNGIANNSISNNKENAQPVELTIKKPRTSLLENYKQTWKPAHNHFQRYSDVKPREERRPNVMDLANQAHVLQKVNGWKIYHLSSQMEDLCELESQMHSKLSNMLQYMETNESVPELERVSDLIKGNMQRSRVIIDGVNEARTQIMKIFEHKGHVSDIIHRCASKRNFKKREKI